MIILHPGSANNYVYAQDIGGSWSREGAYVVWNWVDVNRDGGFSFTEATAEAKDDKPSQRINYDNQWVNVPKDFNLVVNVCPFRKGGSFKDLIEQDTYQNFVEKMVERYDGDDDLGCTLAAPDCYNSGDNQYPSSKVISTFENNPIKFWQMCNQVTDTCDGVDCRNNYTQSFALSMEKTYMGVKNADNSASVLIAGDSSKDLYPAIFEKLNGNYVDIIDYHRFGEEDNYNPREDFEYLKLSLQSSGFNLNNLKFWITETGTYSGDPIAVTKPNGGVAVDFPYQSEKDQALGLIKRYISATSYGIEKVFWAWNIVEGFKRECGQFDYTGLVYDGCDCDENNKYVCQESVGYDLGNGVKKLSYYSYKKMVEVLEGSDWNNIETVRESDGIYIYKFDNQGKSIWVAWDDSNIQCVKAPCGRQITINLGKDIREVKITEAVPNKELGKYVTDYNKSFDEVEGVITDGYLKQLIFELGSVPVFIEEK